jgi:hypothetical protein
LSFALKESCLSLWLKEGDLSLLQQADGSNRTKKDEGPAELRGLHPLEVSLRFSVCFDFASDRAWRQWGKQSR